jgi:monoamine oxidase
VGARPFNAAAGPSTEAQRKAEYVTLQQPHGALYLAGDSMSYVSGWMAGALDRHGPSPAACTSARRGNSAR